MWRKMSVSGVKTALPAPFSAHSVSSGKTAQKGLKSVVFWAIIGVFSAFLANPILFKPDQAAGQSDSGSTVILLYGGDPTSARPGVVVPKGSASVGNWGSGDGEKVRYPAYLGQDSVKVDTESYYQGITIDLAEPIDLSQFIQDPATAFLSIRIAAGKGKAPPPPPEVESVFPPGPTLPGGPFAGAGRGGRAGSALPGGTAGAGVTTAGAVGATGGPGAPGAAGYPPWLGAPAGGVGAVPGAASAVGGPMAGSGGPGAANWMATASRFYPGLQEQAAGTTGPAAAFRVMRRLGAAGALAGQMPVGETGSAVIWPPEEAAALYPGATPEGGAAYGGLPTLPGAMPGMGMTPGMMGGMPGMGMTPGMMGGVPGMGMMPGAMGGTVTGEAVAPEGTGQPSLPALGRRGVPAPAQAPAMPPGAVRVVLVTDKGQLATGSLAFGDGIKESWGWTRIDVPFSELGGSEEALRGRVERIIVTGDRAGDFYVGQVAVVVESKPVDFEVKLSLGEGGVARAGKAIEGYVQLGAGVSSSEVRVVWDFNDLDGLKGDMTRQRVRFAYEEPGYYVITVTVADLAGRRGVVRKEIGVVVEEGDAAGG